MTQAVTLCECFARDGLQHEETFVPTHEKIALINKFLEAGFPRIEATSYSRPEHVPAFRDATEVLAGIRRQPGVFHKATCPNLKAVHRALEDIEAGVGASELSLLVSATQSHSQRNLRSSREEQWGKVSQMADAARGAVRLVGVISVAFGCPFEGEVDEGAVIEDVARFVSMGAFHVTMGDTTGYATPPMVRRMFRRILSEVPEAVPIAHFHDTRGTGLANCLAALEAGCTHFDSAFGGVGGHPARIEYGEGYTGNVVTEDLVNLLEEIGVPTGLDLDRVARISAECERVLGRQLRSMVARSGYGVKHREISYG